MSYPTKCYLRVSTQFQIPFRFECGKDTNARSCISTINFTYDYVWKLGERKKLLAEVEKKWKLREKRDPEESESESDEEGPLEEVEDCIVKVPWIELNWRIFVFRKALEISMLFLILRN
jgi:hypothetical protein